MPRATADGYYSQRREEMTGFVPQSARAILDVGCGSGEFARALKEKRPQARISGVEIDEDAAAMARAVMDETFNGTVEAVLGTLPDQHFDAIVFNDILEHLVSPWDCLREARRILRPEGFVIASIPNMRFWPVLSELLFESDFRYREAGVMDRTHLRFFTRKSITRLFRDSDFQLVELQGINKTHIVSPRWRLLNLVMAGKLQDCLYPQFAVVATPTP